MKFEHPDHLPSCQCSPDQKKFHPNSQCVTKTTPTHQATANPALMPFPPLPWNTRRILVSHDITCPHCGSNSFMLDPDLGVSCTQCAKSPLNPPPQETLTL